MSKFQEKTIDMWECKECSCTITDEESVAFHLIDGYLYGWCRKCFSSSSLKRNQQIVVRPQEQAA